jgi:hypothetical protein
MAYMPDEAGYIVDRNVTTTADRVIEMLRRHLPEGTRE